MNFDDISKPKLIEPGVKYFLGETLKQCREFKKKYHNFILNIVLGTSFFLILGIILFAKYKGKLNPEEKEHKNREKQQYILSKIKNYQETKQRMQQELITGLPHWENEYDIIYKK